MSNQHKKTFRSLQNMVATDFDRVMRDAQELYAEYEALREICLETDPIEVLPTPGWDAPLTIIVKSSD
jgi:hypothetical protein